MEGGVRARGIPQRLRGPDPARGRGPDGRPLQRRELGAPLHARLVLRRGADRSAHRRDPEGQRLARLAAHPPGRDDRRPASSRPTRVRTRRSWPPSIASVSPTELALARIRQLAAHEVGHTLGLDHNFAASTYGRASVMDYPAPLVQIRDGRLDFSDAYGRGIGAFDAFAVRYGYSQFAPGTNEDEALASDRAGGRARRDAVRVRRPLARSGHRASAGRGLGQRRRSSRIAAPRDRGAAPRPRPLRPREPRGPASPSPSWSRSSCPSTSTTATSSRPR